MAYSRTFVVVFGPGKSGLASVGYALPSGARTTAGVSERAPGSGVYQATVSVPSGTQGSILWDTGESVPAYAAEDVNPGGPTEYLDVLVSSRLAAGAYLAAPNDAAIRADVQAALTSQGYTTARAGYLDALNGLVAAIWGYGSRTLTGYGTLVGDVAGAVWAAVSRTLTLTADSPGTTTLLGRLTAARAGGLDDLDAPVSSRLAASAYVAPPSVGAIADAVWGAASRTLTGFGTVAGDAAAAVWGAATRTLSAFGFAVELDRTAAAFDGVQPDAGFFLNAPSAATQVILSVPSALPGVELAGGDLPGIRRGDSWSAALTGLGTLSPRSRLWITAKRDVRRSDGQADFQVTEGDGLLTMGGAAAGAGQAGTLTVVDAAAGTVAVSLTAAATAALGAGDLQYDVQILAGGAVKTLATGGVSVAADVTRAVA